MVLLWFRLGSALVSLGFALVSPWFRLVSPWFRLVSPWFRFGFALVSPWFRLGFAWFRLVLLEFCLGFAMVSLWFRAIPEKVMIQMIHNNRFLAFSLFGCALVARAVSLFGGVSSLLPLLGRA